MYVRSTVHELGITMVRKQHNKNVRRKESWFGSICTINVTKRISCMCLFSFDLLLFYSQCKKVLLLTVSTSNFSLFLMLLNESFVVGRCNPMYIHACVSLNCCKLSIQSSLSGMYEYMRVKTLDKKGPFEIIQGLNSCQTSLLPYSLPPFLLS